MKFSALIWIFSVVVSFPNFDLNNFVAKTSFNVSFKSVDDVSNDGSELKPWKTIDYALWNVPTEGGAEIYVADGVYTGSVVTYRGPKFETFVLVRAETPYHVHLVDPVQHWVLYLSNATNIIFHGFEMYATKRGVKDYIVQIENCTNIVLENCIIHDSFRQVILKVNEHSSRTVIRGCIIYNQPNGLGGAHLVEANIVYNTIIEDCIFFNNYGASNRVNGEEDPVAVSQNASSFLAVKATTEQPEFSDNQIIRRNVFLNWVGAPDRSFIELGGDGLRHPEVKRTVIENNLFINNNNIKMAGLFNIKGNVEDVYISSNTATGHIDHADAYGYVITVGREGYSFNNHNIRIINNIFSDPSGNMGAPFVGGKGADADLTHENETQGWLHNLVFNRGSAVTSPSNAFTPEDAVSFDPLLQADFALAHTPHFVRSNFTFYNGTSDGFLSIEEARKELVTLFAIPLLKGDETVSILNAGRTAFLPFVDILGNQRAATPGSIGAYEVFVNDSAGEVEEDDTVDPGVEDYSKSKQFKDGITVIIVVVVVVVVLSIVAIVVTIIILQIRRNNKKKNITLYLNSSHVSV